MASAQRRELAEIGIRQDSCELQGDDRLFRALVSGCHIENAAVVAGLSERTAYRRLADPTFRKQLDDARQSLRESILARLADGGHDAIGVLTDLMHSSDDENVRLKAAKTLLDSLLATQRLESAPKSVKPRVSLNVGSLSIVMRKERDEVGAVAIDAK